MLVGLFLYPSIFSCAVQTNLLDKLLHRDASIPDHTNNLDVHYEVPVTNTANGTATHQSWFNLDQRLKLHPRDSSIHKPITMKQVLDKKLRWVTLGGQYDWTNKIYPDEQPPQFPPDIAHLLHGTFKDVDPQAAILNFYSPGDTLSLHRDVSEDCDQGLISISVGCDALFLVANNDGSKHEIIRLRSGDAVLMSGTSRYAWHAVPKVLAGTCPASLQTWPAGNGDGAFQQWRDWLANKRINLNVRQMRIEPFERGEPTS